MKHLCIKVGADREPLPAYMVRVWGWNMAGQRVNAFLTGATAGEAGITAQNPFSFREERTARCAAARALGKLGTGVHFWIVHQ